MMYYIENIHYTSSYGHADMEPCFIPHLKFWNVNPFIDHNTPLKISLSLSIVLDTLKLKKKKIITKNLTWTKY